MHTNTTEATIGFLNQTGWTSDVVKTTLGLTCVASKLETEGFPRTKLVLTEDAFKVGLLADWDIQKGLETIQGSGIELEITRHISAASLVDLPESVLQFVLPKIQKLNIEAYPHKLETVVAFLKEHAAEMTALQSLYIYSDIGFSRVEGREDLDGVFKTFCALSSFKSFRIEICAAQDDEGYKILRPLFDKFPGREESIKLTRDKRLQESKERYYS